jgi:hypothetical protein
MNKIGSDDLKTLGMAWLRFQKQLDLVCTEDPTRSADVLGTDSSIQCRKMIEIETKISISDLKADLKKRGKHDWLSKAETYDVSSDHSPLPTQFYFLVPIELKDKALEVIATTYKHAGLMVAKNLHQMGDGRIMVADYLEVAKKAPTLHKRLISKHVKSGIAARMSSELINLRLDKFRDRWNNAPLTGGQDGSDNRTEVLPVSETADGQSGIGSSTED